MAKEILPSYCPVLLGKVGLPLHDDRLEEAHPTLFQLLTPKFEGKYITREPGIISIRIDGSVYRITVVCPTEALQTTFEAVSLMGILDALEMHCASPTAVWVPTHDSKRKAKRGLDRLDARE